MMMRNIINATFLIIFFEIFTAFQKCESANILGIIPTPSFSHQLPFRRLWKELALRGHNVTVMTTDPIKDPSLKNLRQIDTSYSYEPVEKYKFAEVASNESKTFMDIAHVIRAIVNETHHMQLSSPEGQDLIHNNANHFDLLIVEAQLPGMMAFSWRYQCPFIGVSSLDSSMQYHDTAGNPIHPVLNSDPNLPVEDHTNLTFKERIISLIYTLIFKYTIYSATLPRETSHMRKFFGENMPDLAEIQKNMSMLFISTNPLFHSLRPLMPNTITIGSSLLIQPPQELPKDLKQFLDDANQGVVYFSLGSNIKGSILNDTVKLEMLNAFAAIPKYKVLFKIDHSFDKVPKNVMIQKWMPQQDILRHPNVKLFVTQGGLQSLQESAYHGIPVVGIPFFGDQIMNIRRVKKLGFGIELSKKNVTRNTLKNAMLEVIENPKYKKRALEVSEILKDVPVDDLEKAVWWTEYVLRHKGAAHWRSPSVHMPLWKFYMLDVIGFISLVSYFVIFVFCKIFSVLVTLFKTTFIKNKKSVKKHVD